MAKNVSDMGTADIAHILSKADSVEVKSKLIVQLIKKAFAEGQASPKDTNTNKRIENPFAENTKPKKK